MKKLNNRDLNRTIELCANFGGINIATIQRMLSCGYNYSVAILEELQVRGIIGREKNSRHDACGAIYPLITGI